VCALEAKGQNEGDHTFEPHLAVFNQAKVGRLVSKIHGDGTVVPWWFGLASPRSPPRSGGVKSSRHTLGGNPIPFQDNRDGLRALPRNLVECVFSGLAIIRSLKVHDPYSYQPHEGKYSRPAPR